MVKKVKEEKDILSPKIVIGYAVYDTCNEVYLDDDHESCDDSRFAYIHEEMVDAEATIEEMDCPEELEIHKVKYVFEVETVYQRNVVYYAVGGKVKE